nr:olfactory receptor 1 [Matsumurasca onukii]
MLNKRAERLYISSINTYIDRYKSVPVCWACEGRVDTLGDQGPRECCKTEFKAIMLSSSVNYCFRQVFRQHQEIIRSVQLLDRTYRLSMLINNQFAIILIAISILPIIKVFGSDINIAEFYLAMVEIMGWILSTASLCFVGQTLINESTKLRMCVYEYDWISTTPRQRRSLLLMQTVALRDLKLSAGNMYLINMELFASILKATYSYMNVLQALNNKK